MPTAFVLTGIPLSPLRHSLHAKSRAGWRWPCQVRGRAAAGDVTALFSHFTCLGHARDWLHIDGVRGWGIVAARLDARRVRRGALGLELRSTAASCGYRWQLLYGIPCGNVACAWASIWPMAAAIWAQRALAGGHLEGHGEAEPWHLYGGNPLTLGEFSLGDRRHRY